jgi:tyrosine-protein kinase Etk/Wzc
MVGNRSSGGNGYFVQGPDAFRFSEIIPVLRRQRWWIVGTIGAAVAAAVLYSFLRPPVYRAVTTLRVEEQKSTEVPVLDILSQLARGAEVGTEIEIVRSRRVAEGVVAELGLQATVGQPRSVGRGEILSSISVATGDYEGSYRIELGSGSYVLAGPGGRAETDYATAAKLGPLTVHPYPPGERTQNDVIELNLVPFSEAVAGFQRGLDAARTHREASILAISYESTDAALARDAVNSAARHFLALRNNMQKQRASVAVGFLQDQVRSVESQLESAEGDLRLFRQENLIVQAETQITEDVRRLAELQATRAELEVERTALHRLLVEVQSHDSTRPSWASLAAFPTFLKNQAISTILEELTHLETELSRLRARRTGEDPDRLADLASSYLAALDRQAISLDATLATLDAQLQKVPEVEVHYARLRRNADLLGELYTILQTRLKEAEVSEAIEIANIQVVDPAITPVKPVKPRKILNLIFGLVLGTVIAVGITFVRESVDTRLRSRDELSELTGVPVLATVPRIPITNGRRLDAPAKIEARLVTHHSPKSPAAEAYRALRTNLTFSSFAKDRPIRKVVFTSAEPQEGKSTTAANVALSLAEQGHRTLLIECDLRRPVLHKVFGVPRTPGLVDALSQQADLAQVAQSIPLPDHAQSNLDLVPAGTSPPNPAELLGSQAMSGFLDEAATRYEMVVLDTPPLAVVTDAAVVGTLVDGVVVVTRQGSTHRDALRLACEELRGVNATIVGTVLNDLTASGGGYGYRYAYRHYYGTDGD